MALYSYNEGKCCLRVKRRKQGYHISTRDDRCNITFNVADISPLSDASAKVLGNDNKAQFFWFSEGSGSIQKLPEGDNGLEHELQIQCCSHQVTLLLPESEVTKLAQLPN